MSLQDSQKNKKQKQQEQQSQQPRQRRLTYVAGIEGRRYVNDKVLRNLEQSQRNSNGEYIAYTTPDDSKAGYVPFDPFVGVDASELLQGNSQYQQPETEGQESWGSAENAWDQSTEQGLGEGVSLNQAEVAEADLQAAFDKAAGTRSVHATHHDLSKGAFTEANAYNEPSQVAYDAHGYQEQQPHITAGDAPPPQAYAQQPAGEVHTTQYDGYQDPAYEAVFGDMAQQQQAQRELLAAQQAEHAAQAEYDSQQHAYLEQQQHYQQSIQGSQQNQTFPPADVRPGTKPVSVRTTGQHKAMKANEDYKKLLGGLFMGESGEQEPAPEKPVVKPFPEYSESQEVQPEPQPQVNYEEQAQPQYQQSPPEQPLQGQPSQVQPSQVQPQEAPEQDGRQQQQSGQQIQNLAQSYTHGLANPDAAPTRKPTRIPVKIERVKPPLPRQRNDEIYFEDNATSGKTSIFKMPSEGVVQSSRGTVELLVHKGGRMFRPHYNAVGILLRVDVSDGFSLIKGSTDKAHWQMTDRDGNPLDEEDITSVAFDKKGNLWYETVSGKKTKFLVTGAVEVSNPKKKP